MLVYIINFIVNMIIGLMLVPKEAGAVGIDKEWYNKKKKLYLIITTIQLGLLCGFRASSVGYDTAGYEGIFEKTPTTIEGLRNHRLYVETGYLVLSAIIKLLGGDFQTLLIISSLFVIGSCCVFIYRHSCNVVLSVFTIICFPFYYSSFDIIRHFISISFLFLGYKYILEKKFAKYVLYLLIGSIFHRATLLFIPFYFIRRVKYDLTTLCVTLFATILSFFFLNYLDEFITDFLGKGISEGWIGEYAGGGWKTIAMYFVIFLIALYLYNQLKTKTMEDNMAIMFALLMLSWSIIFIQVRMMTRMIMTFAAFLSIGMPRLLDSRNASHLQDRDICHIAYIAIGLVYHAFMLFANWQNVVPYVPFWA